MKSLIAMLRGHLLISIWPIPLFICLVNLGLAFLVLWLERNLSLADHGMALFAIPVAAARQMLGVIATSVISVGGIVFSVTMVALTLTSGQYGPKVLRQFLEDSDSEITLGLFLGTSIYALVTMSAYVESDRPQLTVITALLLTLLALIGFIRFIHSTAIDLQADRIIQRIGGRLLGALNILVAEDNLQDRTHDTSTWRRLARSHPARQVGSLKSGYVQSVDYPCLVQWCVANDCQILVNVRAGDFLVEGAVLLKVYGCAEQRLGQQIEALNRQVLTGPLRTPLQDPEYPITQLNQLAARALSPGINDPGTAMTCVDWFNMALAPIVDRDMPGKVVQDSEGIPRLLIRFSDFSGIAKAIYAPFRQFARKEISVVIGLIDSLARLAELTTRQDRLDVLALHGELIWQDVQREAMADYDLSDVRRRYTRLLALTSRLR